MLLRGALVIVNLQHLDTIEKPVPAKEANLDVDLIDLWVDGSVVQNVLLYLCSGSL